ncbi:MAG: hypothetical protein KDC10_16515, partial [Calditrichaeota bacterium]|nr:hypothetical protein [Calditrichota bacterium]
MKRSLTLLTLLALGAGSVHADVSRVTRQATPQAPAAPALQAARDWVEPSPVVPKAHTQRTDWETVVVGTTRYDYQHNGSTSRMLAVSSDGIVHGSFMGGVDVGNGRRVQAWCVDPTDLSLTGPTDVLSQRTGYTTSAVTGPNPVNALPANSGVVGMHSSTPPVSWLAVDFAGCTLAFNLMQHSGDDYIWPHISVDGMDRVHMVGYGADDSDAPSTIFYDATTNGTSWDNGSFLVVSDNTESLGAVAVANNHSNRAAVVYLEKTGPEDVPYDGPLDPPEIGQQIHHDVKAYLADDGNVSAQIMAENSMNLTDYGPGSESPFGPYGCRGYSDVDGLFDMSNE